MKKIIVFIMLLFPFLTISQPPNLKANDPIPDLKMKIGMVIYSNDPETVWNAFRFGNFALGEGDSIKVFLLSKGVESESLDNDKFKVTDQIKRFIENGGKIFACGTCLTIRKMEGTELCPLSSMQDMYDIIKWSNKVITF
jgi:sulfur relay (sulfurtransferase) complex TusBCD TusD component (DsrE family)